MRSIDVCNLSPIEDWSLLLKDRRSLLVKRDDLLPFPLPGNKYRKLSYELERLSPRTTSVITVGSMHSNHCRTTALMCAQKGLQCRLVLHDDGRDPLMSAVGAKILDMTGATYDVVRPDEIRSTLESLALESSQDGEAHFIEGGCHTLAGVQAYEDAVEELAHQLPEEPAYIFLASGTGATQAGIAVGCQNLGWSTMVLGVSVARPRPRGLGAVMEAISWRGNPEKANTDFLDEYRAGGYGSSDEKTNDVVALAWSSGLPVDPVYTGKALTAVIDMVRTGQLEAPGPIVFWHTGGIVQGLLKNLAT